MKKILLIAAMIVSTLTAAAQNEAGGVSIKPRAGITIAKITNCESNMKVGFIGGAEVEYGISKRFGISGGLDFAMLGARKNLKIEDVDYTRKANVNYLQIPVMLKFYVVEGLAIQAGVKPAFCVASNIAAEINGVKESAGCKEYTNTVDFSIPVGLAWEYANFVLDARYNIGCTNVYKTSTADKMLNIDNTGKNSAFEITLGYRFRL